MKNYTYNRTWEDIHALLDEAERTKNQHKTATFNERLSTKQRAQHMRDYKGLQGVVYSLRWVLGDPNTSRKKVITGEE